MAGVGEEGQPPLHYQPVFDAVNNYTEMICVYRATVLQQYQLSGYIRGPVLQSELACCVWIPLFPLRCEESRQPELAAKPAAILSPHDTKRLWHVSPLAQRAGAKPGMTVSQAIGLCPALTVCEPDPVFYDDRFAQLLLGLSQVSPVVEPAELGRAYVGTDGLERLYGPPEQQVKVIADCGLRIADWKTDQQTNPQSAFRIPQWGRLGWGRGKFLSWVAATRAAPGAAVIVRDHERRAFLASQPVAVLPLDPDTHRRLYQLGLKKLGDLTALPEAAIVSQFGGQGRLLWRLAAGELAEPVIGRAVPEPIVAEVDFPAPVADRELLVQAITKLIERALKSPRRTGFRVQVVRVRMGLEQGASWLTEVTLKDPSAERDRLAAPLKTRLEQSPPTGAVERLAVEFTRFAPGTTELQLFARDAASAARARRRHALREAVNEIKNRLKRTLLYHVIEVHPWSRLPERRYALIDYEP